MPADLDKPADQQPTRWVKRVAGMPCITVAISRHRTRGLTRAPQIAMAVPAASVLRRSCRCARVLLLVADAVAAAARGHPAGRDLGRHRGDRIRLGQRGVGRGPQDPVGRADAARPSGSAWWVLLGATVVLVPLFLLLGRYWQNDVRDLMGMDSLERVGVGPDPGRQRRDRRCSCC